MIASTTSGSDDVERRRTDPVRQKIGIGSHRRAPAQLRRRVTVPATATLKGKADTVDGNDLTSPLTATLEHRQDDSPGTSAGNPRASMSPSRLWRWLGRP
jgi:hypothetical protein